VSLDRGAVIYTLGDPELEHMTRREGTLQDHEARARLYEVLRSDENVYRRLEAALEVGIEYFGVDHGYVTEIDRETGDWQIVTATDPPDGPFPEGLQLELATTYCRHTIHQGGVFTLYDAPEQGYGDDVAFETHGIHCYHGAPIVVEDETYGTVCFSSKAPRAAPFSETEKAFTQLIAQMAGHEIERHRNGRELDRREHELEERRQIYRAVIDANFDLVFRLDESGRFSFVSDPVSELLGYSPTELEGRPFTSILPDEEAVALGSRLFDRVMDDRTVEERCIPIETARGDTVEVDVRATPIYRAGVEPPDQSPEEIVAVQGTAREATQRKRRERLIRVLNRVLRHNLRNDMTVVRGHANRLRRNLSAENAATAEVIVETADKLVELGETARDLERYVATTPEIEPTNVVPAVTAAIATVEAGHPDASIAFDGPDTAMAPSAPRLETAVTELLENAATHAGESPSIDVEIWTDPDRVAIRLADDGPGLPPQERSVLAAGRETPLEHGSGLGLWLVYWIVTSLAGTLDVSDDGPGTTVVVSLPRASVDRDGRTTD
jgi:PAS domain S-box-containing protein